MKKFIPLCTPYFDGKEKEYLHDCVESTFVSTAGKYIELFEENLKLKTKSDNVVSVNSGTSALHLSLLAAGVKPNDLVITSDYSFIATANSIAYCNAEPVLIDVDYDSFNISLDLVEKFLYDECTLKDDKYFHNETGKKVSAFVPVFALGNVICPSRLKRFKNKFKIPLIIDAAAAIGVKGDSMEIGEFAFDFATLSFNGNKIITCGAGGAILCKDSRDYEKVKHLAATARLHPSYFHDEVGFNYRMTNISAALGLAQLEKIDKLLDKKHEIFNFYKKNLESEYINFYEEPDNLFSSKWISGFLFKNNSEKEIIEFNKFMAEEGIGASSFWAPISSQKAFANSIKNLSGNSAQISQKFIALPSSIDLKNEELIYIVKTIKKYFEALK